MSQDQPFISWVGLKVGSDRVSGDLLGGAKSVSVDDGVSDMAPASWLCGSVGEGFQKGTMASAHLSV